MFGTIIGVGWITASGSWLQNAGTIGAIIAFAGGALVMLAIGFCFAELSSMMPESAGAIAFGHRAFGPAGCFVIGWLLIMAYFVFTAYYVISIVWLINATGFSLGGPELYRVNGEGVYLGSLVAGTAAALMVTLSNAIGAGASAKFQDALVWGLVVFVLVLFVTSLSFGNAQNMQPLFAGATASVSAGAILAVMATTPVWFSGFDVLPQMMRERHPSVSAKSIGMIMALGILAAFIFYALVIIATSHLLGAEALAVSQVPAFDAFATGADSVLLARLVLIAGLLGILTTWNATIFSGSRIIAAMSKAGFLPGRLGYRSKSTGVPVLAVVALGFAPIPLGLLGSGGADAVIASSSLAFLIVFVLVCLAAVKLRREEPQVERPFRMPLGTAMAWIALVLSLLLIIAALLDSLRISQGLPIEWTLLVGWLLLGIPVWFLGKPQRRQLDELVASEAILGSS